jgi:hypothetical protein
VAVIVGVGGIREFTSGSIARAVTHFWDVKLSRLTNSGNVIDATISPDGKYIVYALSDRSSQSLYIRQVSTANDKLIVPPAPLAFSDDFLARRNRALLRAQTKS